MKQLILIGMLLGSIMPGLRAEGPPQPPRPPVAKDEPKEEPKVATGERIEIPDVGFSIVPPNGWMVHKNSHGSSLLFEAPKQPNQIYQPTLQVMVFSKLRYIDEVTMKEYGDLIVEKFGKMSNRVTGYRLRDAAIQRLETGDPSILYYTEFQYDDVPIMQMHILISSATNHFVMTYTDVAKVFEDESSPGLAIAYTSMHSAQLDSRPPWRWRGFVIGGAAVFLVIMGWFTLRFMRARRMAKLGQRIEDEDNKEITRDEESQYYSRHSPATHADSHVGDEEWASSKPKSKAAAKVSQVQSSHFDEDDEPEVSDVVPISTLEKSLHPARKRRQEAAAAAPRHSAPPPVSQQPVSQHPPISQHQSMQGMNAAPVPPPHAHAGHGVSASQGVNVSPPMNASQPMHPGMSAQGTNSSQPMHPGMPAHTVNPQGMQGVNPAQAPYPGMPANGTNPNQAMHPGMPAQAMNPNAHPGMPAQAMNPTAHPGMPAQAMNPNVQHEMQAQAINPNAHPGVAVQATNPTAYPGMPAQANNPNAHPGMPAQAMNPNAHPGMPAQAMNPNAHPGMPAQAMNPTAHPGMLAQAINPNAQHEMQAQAMNPNTHPGMPAQAMNPNAHPGMPSQPMNPQDFHPAQAAHPGAPVNPQGAPLHPGMAPSQQQAFPGVPTASQAMPAQGNSTMPQPAAPQHAMHAQQSNTSAYPQQNATHTQQSNPSAYPQNLPPHAMMPPPSAPVQHAGYPQDQQAVSQHPFAAPGAPQAAMPSPIPESVVPTAPHFGQDQATTASFMPHVHAQAPASEQPAYVQKAAAPAAQAYSAPAAPSFAASVPTTVSAMPQFAPPAEPVSEPPVTASRPQAKPMSRKQPLSQNDDDEPEMTEEARLSEILPKAGTIEKSKPKRKGLFWRKKTEDDDDQDEGGEDKASWNMPASKKSKGKSEDEDNDNDGDGDSDEWAVASGGNSPSAPVEKDDEASLETDAWAPEATKKSDPKRDSLLNETQGPQRLVRRSPQGPVTKEQNNAAVTEDGWNLSPEVASDHDEEDEEEVS